MITIDDIRRASPIHESWKDREARRAAALARVPAPELVARVLQLEQAVTDLRHNLNSHLIPNPNPNRNPSHAYSSDFEV